MMNAVASKVENENLSNRSKAVIIMTPVSTPSPQLLNIFPFWEKRLSPSFTVFGSCISSLSIGKKGEGCSYEEPEESQFFLKNEFIIFKKRRWKLVLNLDIFLPIIFFLFYCAYDIIFNTPLEGWQDLFGTSFCKTGYLQLFDNQIFQGTDCWMEEIIMFKDYFVLFFPFLPFYESNPQF